jgi:hypothetical protein
MPKQVCNGDGSKIGGGVLERTLDKEIKNGSNLHRYFNIVVISVDQKDPAILYHLCF